jgi:dihydroorotate dehydrogenase (fumarate)
MHSLFEEQLVEEQMAAYRMIDALADMMLRPPDSCPRPAFRWMARAICAELAAAEAGSRHAGRRLPQRQSAPVAGRTTRAGSAAGASALELNLYDIATTRPRMRPRWKHGSPSWWRTW